MAQNDSSHSSLGCSRSASGHPSNIWKSTVGSSRWPSGLTCAMASWNNGDFIGSPIRCNHTPSPDSNSVAPVCALGMPISSDGDGCSTRRQCIAIGTERALGDARVRWAGVPGALARDQAGHDPDGAEV